jgi:lipopolysaccharide transport system permease protein
MSYIVRGYQDRLLSGRLPGWEELLLPAAAAGAMFIAGGLFFRYMKRGFADVL